MNYQINSSNIKGKEEISMAVWPSNNLEREFFNTLFAAKVSFEIVPNSETIIIKPCRDASVPLPEIDKLEVKLETEHPESAERSASNGNGG